MDEKRKRGRPRGTKRPINKNLRFTEEMNTLIKRMAAMDKTSETLLIETALRYYYYNVFVPFHAGGFFTEMKDKEPGVTDKPG